MVEEAYAYQLLAETMFTFLNKTINAFLSLTGIENKNVIHDPFLSVTLSASEDDQILSKLGA